MCLIDVPNLKEINQWEGYFMWFKNSSKAVQRRRLEENAKKIGQFLEVYILFTTNPISCKVMYVYVEH